MLDPDEPNQQTQEPTQEATQETTVKAPQRHRRVASRPAGPPSSAPDAPKIERVAESSEPVDDGLTDAVAPAAEQAAKKTTVKRGSRKAVKETPNETEVPLKATRKRTSKKAVVMAAEAPSSEEAQSVLTESAEPAPSSDAAAVSQAALAAGAVGNEAESSAAPADQAPTEATEEMLETSVKVADAAEEVAEATYEAIEATEAAAEAVEVATEAVEQAAEAVEAAESAEEAPTESEAGESEAIESEAGESEAIEGEAGEGPRRRRRRGGRRRRRTGSDEAVSTQAASEEVAQPEGDESADVTAGDETSSEVSRRRRRRRRRRGEEATSAPDDPTEVVVRVREPRQAGSTDVVGIDGSTRMEAKRQRRREGREAGRRRTPVLSEAEFLARRESVVRKMIIRQRENLSQIAVLEDDLLVEHYVDRDSTGSLIGNVYLGRVQNVLPSMEAAFVDIGRGRNGVIYAGEVDWDYFGAEGQNRKVEKVLKSGQTILVQVTKDPVGAKGARLTNHVSIPGRYIVYAPGGHLSGISRKLPESERRRLKDILSGLVGESASVIVRTAAEGATEEELVRDVNRLKAQWEDIERKIAAGNAPQLLYSEPDLTVRIVRDLFTEDFSELIISGNGGMTDAYDSIEAYVTHVAPHLKDRLRRWESDHDLFAEFRLDEQIAKALERKVFLPSGGSLIIDRTEAMTVIDVNTGKFTGTGGNLESTVTSNNLEAAEEIVRQLRLRDIGGIIVIDFIDMVLPSNRELLLRRLVECLGRDRTRHQVAEITSLGLVQMTRKRIGTGLLEAFTTECPHCHGRGYELHDMPVESQRHADGGARDSRSPDRRGNAARAASEKAPDTAISIEQLDGNTELAVAAERPAARSRRGGRRRSAAVKEESAAEPQDEPAVVS
ncbi:MAG TPA: Rne/Rng family ribonuclease [Propionibacteriaceae bacterium]